MESRPPVSTRGRVLILGMILLAGAAVRLYQIRGPLIDQLNGKQIYIANRARNIAMEPLDILRTRLDFLTRNGQQLELTEEIPLYTGIVGLSYHAFGELEWIGRIVSILATLVAILALYDLIKREYDPNTALIAAILFSITPLMTFYGRAVLPDPCMLACMLLTVCCYHRYWDNDRSTRWLIATAACGLLGAAFKYYGLMVMVPLMDLARRRAGWKACLSPHLIGIGAVMTVPIFSWVAFVFFRTANPTSRGTYFIWQEPKYLLHPRLYERLFLGFFVRDCGPFLAALILAGGVVVARKKADAGPIWGWTVMGITFYFLLGRKLLDHDYYELMMLPAAATWGALGWCVLWGEASRMRRARLAWVGVATLAVAAVVQSPWIMKAKFEQETGYMVIAARLNELCSPTGRVIVIGQKNGWAVVHYCDRKGWVDESPRLPSDWRTKFGKFHAWGAEFLAVYFDPTTGPAARESYRPVFEALPVVEHRTGPFFRGGRPGEYYLLDLRKTDASVWRVDEAESRAIASNPRETR